MRGLLQYISFDMKHSFSPPLLLSHLAPPTIKLARHSLIETDESLPHDITYTVGLCLSPSLWEPQSKKGKNVFMLSTMHSVPERCKTSGKPQVVLTYNKSRGGVDTMDQMAYAFIEKRKRWLLVVLFNIIDLSTNATRVIRQARLSEHKLPHDGN
ncbi:PiggyBac transposable element-derived protein 4 [Plakobranchus ocellatus]|uniref:PiggyBac transposable element-derived protein 4 n=1 Tax=Plakobranchus ocellatus TaxID=259542 RepID=A0AAV4DMF4_9GAST|nr:PiggyBac transposable element-derived protein 4 [Plakobranchus ocellatus]